jgi:hypothetical protein
MTRMVIGKRPIPRTITQGFGLFVLLIASAALAQSTGNQLPRESFVGAISMHGNVFPQTGDHSPAIAIGGAASSMNTGPLFLPPVLYDPGAPGAGPFVIADLNGDARPDVVLLGCANDCSLNDPSVIEVLLGNGDGTFQAARRFDLPLTAVSLAVSDVNKDGKQDVVVVGSTDVCVLLGNGDGTLAGSSCFIPQPGINPTRVTASDVNGDGKPDLVLTFAPGYAPWWPVEVLLGNGDGTFQTSSAYHPLPFPITFSVTAADVNGDGKPDLLAVTDLSIVYVLLGNGDGTFQTPVGYASGKNTTSLAVGDLNDDGKPDLVVGNNCATKGCNEIGVLLGNGDGTFQPVTSYAPNGGPTFSVAVADVNGDGRLDVLAGLDLGADSSTASALLGNGDGTLQSPVDFTLNPAYPYVTWIATADVNGDLRPDLIAVNGRHIEVLLNDTGPHRTSTTALLSNAAPADPNQLVTYTATVTSEYPGPVTGTVTFQDGIKAIATGALSDRVATYTLSYPKAGKHLITATYSGDYYSAGSSSPTLAEYVEILPIPSSTHLATSGSPSLVGQPVTFTATVTSKFGSIPDGELVTFSDGKTVLGSVPLQGGTAIFTTSSLPAKSQTIIASYAGDATFKPSSGHILQDVVP